MLVAAGICHTEDQKAQTGEGRQRKGSRDGSKWERPAGWKGQGGSGDGSGLVFIALEKHSRQALSFGANVFGCSVCQKDPWLWAGFLGYIRCASVSQAALNVRASLAWPPPREILGPECPF